MSSNASAINGYAVTPYLGAIAQSASVFASIATTETVFGLTNGKTYSFKIAAKNALGTGPSSVASNPIRVGVPTAPRSPLSLSGNASASVSWLAPVSNNGSAITGYIVTPYDAGIAQAAQTFTSTSTTEVVSGLNNGTSYVFRVAAMNSVGTGAQSVATSPIVIGVPAAPRRPSAATGNASAMLTWIEAPVHERRVPRNRQGNRAHSRASGEGNYRRDSGVRIAT